MPDDNKAVTCAVVTVSTSCMLGTRQDDSGPIAVALLLSAGFILDRTYFVTDELMAISDILKQLSDDKHMRLIVTTGGTGLSPDDVTPEATLNVIDRVVPGISEAMRAATLAKTPMAMLSRGVAGIRGQCLIVNLPGSPKAVKECLEVITPVLRHAIEIIEGAGHPNL